LLDLHNLLLINSSYYWKTFIADVSPSLSKTKALSSEGSTSGVPSPVTQAKGKEHVTKPKLTHVGFVQAVPIF
jgi:hypothetical protein